MSTILLNALRLVRRTSHGSTVAVEVVVVADAFGNRRIQHIVLRIAPVGFGQTVSGVLFLSRYFPLVRPMIWPLPL